MEARKLQADKLRDINYKTGITTNLSSDEIVLNRTQGGIHTSIVNNSKYSSNAKPVKGGFTTENEGHRHKWTLFDDGVIIIHDAKHPQEVRIKHGHDYRGTLKKGWITYNQSECHKDNIRDPQSCESLYGISGAASHKHHIRMKI